MFPAARPTRRIGAHAPIPGELMIVVVAIIAVPCVALLALLWLLTGDAKWNESDPFEDDSCD